MEGGLEQDQMKSILQNKKECYLCRKKADLVGWDEELSEKGLHRHHIVFGTADRNISEQYGVWCWVCADKHHEHGPESPHQNREVAELLIKDAQEKFERIHGHDKWMNLYKRSWI